MAAIPHIRLADYAFGPEDGTLLLGECLENPHPRTIGELARMYLARRLKDDKGYTPYDCRRSYAVGDRVALCMHGKPTLAQVVEVTRDWHMDRDNVPCDKIDLVFLDEAATHSSCESRSFIANYAGVEYAGRQQASFEIITEADETELIPKILIAVSNDRRFVAFGDRWLPVEFLVTGLSTHLDLALLSIAKEKRALTTREILANLPTQNVHQPLEKCSAFSLNYYLERDHRFTTTCDAAFDEGRTAIKWDLQKPTSPIQLEVERTTLSYGRLATTPKLDLLLCYHGFVSQCSFAFSQIGQVDACYDFSEHTISGDDFVGAVLALSKFRRYVISFEHPERRGGAIRVCVVTGFGEVAKEMEATVTVREQWLNECTLVLPRRLANHVKTDLVRIQYDGTDELLPYDKPTRRVSQLGNFYSLKAIADGDKVHMRLQDTSPASILVYSRWKRTLGRLLRITPHDLQWERSSLRDCIIVTLAHFKGPAHYREIYAQIAGHKRVSLTSVIGTLSRYGPSVFAHVGWGQWQLADGTARERDRHENASGENRENIVITDEAWNAVATIVEEDCVYDLLQRIGRPLSYDEICDKLADHLAVSASQLRATGFLDAADGRLKRLDDGTWGLHEWFTDKDLCEDGDSNRQEEAADLRVPSDMLPVSGSLTRVALIIVLALLFVAVGSMLVWLLVHRR